jgi:ADP-ribose pyrophosphatase YjhB (NUDIX family)
MHELAPADHGFALFGPDFGVPVGGFCSSVFVLPRRDGAVLAGRMARSDRWEEEWQPNMAYYDGDRYDALFEGWRFPATYLREGEHPEAAARRVWSDQLGLGTDPELGSPRIVSSAAESRRAPGAAHWDLIFLYEAQGPDELGPPPDHWAEWTYLDPDAAEPDDLVMLHGGLIEDL